MRNLLVVIICFLASPTFSQDLDCKKFKNGKFKIESEISGTSIIERKGSKQIEHGLKVDIKIELKVKWTSTCSYTLSLKKILENPNDYPMSDMVVLVDIIETKENSYVQRSSIEGTDFTVVSEVVRIDE